MDKFLDTLKSLHERCQHNQHRALVVISGERHWTQTVSADICTTLPQLQTTTIADSASAKKLLGSDSTGIIFDAFSGFNLNALAISAGTIMGGGLMILQCPPLHSWDSFDDPEYQRLLAHPFSTADISGFFLQRLSRILSNDASVLCLEQNAVQNTFVLPPKTQPPEISTQPYASVDQAAAVQKIIRLCGGRARRPLLITADRGRGKSAALGLAAATLLADEKITITITAPSPKAVATAIKHANNPNLKFVSPDELLDKKPESTLLLIDEAAAIPLPLLQALVSHYARVVLTTTVHGYEGTGRSFQLRFSEVLNRITPNWEHFELSQAVRFANNDPLEQFIHRALILDPELTDVTVESSAKNLIKVESRKELAANESKLRSVFGLLMLAHYQTTPDDLRHMLDAPNIDVFTLNVDDDVVATAMVATEGSLDEALIEEIYNGERRPKGHLLPQTLIFQCNLPEAGVLQAARVIRIAVLPKFARRGFGSELLAGIEKHYRDLNFDLIGTSFGLERGLLKFWQAQNYHCVRVGSRRNAASTYHSGLLIKPLNEVAAHLSEKAQKRFAPLFAAQLPSVFKKLDPQTAGFLISDQKETPSVTENVTSESQSYINGKRNRYDVLDSLQKLLVKYLIEQPKDAQSDQVNLLIACLLQQHPDKTLCQQFQIDGAKSLTSTLRDVLQNISSQKR